VDVLKIDKSFIDAGTNAENDEIVLSNIIHMAKELKMDVITEGVENWEQVGFLRGMDCNLVQGFLFDRPMPTVAFEQKLMEKQYSMK
jgi:sensor c-di-GMP phosphodiesterase-like protein